MSNTISQIIDTKEDEIERSKKMSIPYTAEKKDLIDTGIKILKPQKISPIEKAYGSSLEKIKNEENIGTLNTTNYQKKSDLNKPTLYPLDENNKLENAVARLNSILTSESKEDDKIKMQHLTSINASNKSKKSKKLKNVTKTKKPLGAEIAEAIKRNEAILRDMTTILLKNVNIHNENLINLSYEDEKNLKGLIKQLEKKESSDIVKSILNIVSSSTAITIGSFLLKPETIAFVAKSAALSTISPLWSYVMIASGISNILVNEIFPKFDFYEKVASFFASDNSEKKELASNIQIVSTLTNATLTIASSIASLPIISSLVSINEGFNIFNYIINFGSTTTNFIGNINDSQYNNLQAEQTKVEGDTKLEQSKLDNAYKKLQSQADLEEAFYKISTSIFQSIQKISSNSTLSTKNANLGLVLAKAATNEIDSLNTRSRSIEIFEEIKKAKDENDLVVKGQKTKGWSHGITAGAMAVTGIALAAFHQDNNDLLKHFSSFANIESTLNTAYTGILDAKISDGFHSTRVAQTALESLIRKDNADDSLMTRYIDHVGRLLAKESV